jgi:predicted DNA repair protein MutK
MLGGAYLCYEGAEKVYEAFFPHAAHEHEKEVGVADPKVFEERTVSSAIRTDFILSAEIMAIALASIDSPSFWTKAGVLAVVAVGITAAVYGAVALIVKADDVGVALAANGRGRPRPASAGARARPREGDAVLPEGAVVVGTAR